MAENIDSHHVVDFYTQQNGDQENLRGNLNLNEQERMKVETVVYKSSISDKNSNFLEDDYKFSNSVRRSDIIHHISEQNTVSHFSNNRSVNGERIKIESEKCSPVNVPATVAQDLEDDCEAFGNCVTAQLKQMSRLQKCIAQRVISEVCFRGQMRSLSIHTSLSTQSTAFPQIQKPTAVYAQRPPNFGAGNDYMVMTHRENISP